MSFKDPTFNLYFGGCLNVLWDILLAADPHHSESIAMMHCTPMHMYHLLEGSAVQSSVQAAVCLRTSEQPHAALRTPH